MYELAEVARLYLHAQKHGPRAREIELLKRLEAALKKQDDYALLPVAAE